MATKIADTTPVADGASIEAFLTTQYGLEAVQRLIMEQSAPMQKPSTASIATRLQALLTP
jgi:hypothetical protein